MINFDFLEANVEEFSKKFLTAIPYEHIVIDNFCNKDILERCLKYLPDPKLEGYNKSNDYIFAKNKFEKSEFNALCSEFSNLKSELLSERFSSWVSNLTKQKIFIDPAFHGGGLHQGGVGSYLDIHADFNYHPENLNWFRNINILLYLNKNWEEEYKGELKLIDGRLDNGEPLLIEPIFNRAVIMFTRDYTLHGYDPINFPDGSYRSSIAAYGYSLTEKKGKLRTTIWKPQKSSFKRFLGLHMPKLVSIKSRLFGSGTTKNK